MVVRDERIVAAKMDSSISVMKILHVNCISCWVAGRDDYDILTIRKKPDVSDKDAKFSPNGIKTETGK